MIKAVIFDLDGLLIDSEPFWRDALVEVLGNVGVPLTHDMTGQTMGKRVDEVVDYWHKKYPWDSPSTVETADKIVAQVISRIKTVGGPMPGVREVFKFCHYSKLPIAVASSSAPAIIEAAMNKLGITKDVKVICSAYSEKFGKPHPAVYLTTLNELNRILGESLRAEQCLVFEDSVNGILAAKAAGMKCVAIPFHVLEYDQRIEAADVKLESLHEFTPELLDKFMD